MTIKEWQEEVHRVAKEHGWYDDSLADLSTLRIMAMLANVHCEVSEAAEWVKRGELGRLMDYEGKSKGFPTELADIMIRVMDMAEALNIDLEEEVRIKNEYNKTRPYRHGGKTV